jgi:protein SCO1
MRDERTKGRGTRDERMRGRFVLAHRSSVVPAKQSSVVKSAQRSSIARLLLNISLIIIISVTCTPGFMYTLACAHEVHEGSEVQSTDAGSESHGVKKEPGDMTSVDAKVLDEVSKAQSSEAAISESPGIKEKLGDMVAVDAMVLDEEGKPFRFGDLVSIPTIILPVYYDCPDACNYIQSNIARILTKVDLVPGKDYQILSLSFDPKETPEKARKAKTDFIPAIGAPWPEGAWRFLTGDGKDVESIMKSIGFTYQKVNNQVVHPILMVALAPGGKVVRYLYGNNPLPFDITMAMTEANKGHLGLSVKRALAFCFSYDPEGKRYTVNVLRIGGIVVAGFAITFFLVLTLGGRKKRQTKQ